MKTLTRAEFDYVRKATVDAEKGGATLSQLARAIEICEKVGDKANGTLSFLREAVRHQVPVPLGKKAATDLKTVVLGVFTGYATWFFLIRHQQQFPTR